MRHIQITCEATGETYNAYVEFILFDMTRIIIDALDIDAFTQFDDDMNAYRINNEHGVDALIMFDDDDDDSDHATLYNDV